MEAYMPTISCASMSPMYRPESTIEACVIESTRSSMRRLPSGARGAMNAVDLRLADILERWLETQVVR